MNIDFCLSEALKYNMEGIKQALLSYDLMCQFWKNLERRFQGNPHLTFPQALETLRAIGLFHVHGHVDHCYARYAPTFIPGAGMVDGEVLETLWAALNKIADSARSQSTAHRRETLDDLMNDSNWKKLVGLSESYDRSGSRCSSNWSQSTDFAKNLHKPENQQKAASGLLMR